jgi:hypothetical protein
VKADPKDAYRADRDFFLLVVKSRVIAAAMKILGFKDKSSKPEKCQFPDDIASQSREYKLRYLHKAAAHIVDELVMQDSVCNIFNEIAINQEKVRNSHENKTADGRYSCRFHGCNRSFKYDGLSREKHEATHNPPPEHPREMASLSKTDSNNKEAKCTDDIYNYNSALLEDGLFFLNFLDAISEGDGIRIMRQYKYLLMSFKADGQQSAKYALECLYQSFLVNALLSARDVERFIWNRSVNTFGGIGRNIALDIDMEHSNRFVKQSIKNIGPNLTEKAVSRICKSEKGVSKVVHNIDKCLQRNPGSGRHTRSSTDKDLAELIDRALSTDVYSRHEHRKYNHFVDFKRHQIEQLDMSSMYKWINYHKNNIDRGIKAR